jgi:RNA polymerase sigma factor (TIGR02999 family)
VGDRSSTVGGLLRAWGRGDLRARDAVLPLVYAELRRRAARYLHKERLGHTLQPTALVHEAYLRLVGEARVPWRDRLHFYRVATRVMRRCLVDHARAQRAAKRPSPMHRVALEEAAAATVPRGVDLLELDRALTELSVLDARLAEVVELRYFCGLSEVEIARALAVSRSTVTRECQTARAWLYRRMSPPPERRAEVQR